MLNLNRVSLAGNLTKDPDMRYIPSGTAVATMSMACNRRWKDKEGNKKEDVSYVRVIAWGKMGENCAEYLKKGSPVFVEGRMQSRSWEGADGKKQYGMDVIATSVQFLGGKKEEKKAEEPPAAPSPTEEDKDSYTGQF